MGNLPWLEDVRKRLVGRNLPPAYVQRFTAELGDHLHDLEEEAVDVDLRSRLGEPEQVACAAVVAYRRRSFLGRHPAAAFLVFAISPVVIHCALLFVALMSLAVILRRGAIDWHEQRWELSLCIVVCSVLSGMLYSELALRLGLARKWAITSCVVLGVMAMFWDLGAHRYAGAGFVMLPLQFVVPLVLGRWLAERKWNDSRLATTFLIFAVSPVVSYWVLYSAAAMVFLFSQEVDCTPTYSLGFLLVTFVVASAVVSRCCWKLAGRLGPGKKWMLVGCVVLFMLPSLPFMFMVLIYVVPAAVASLLYCRLAMRLGIGPKWVLVSCMAVAAVAALHYSWFHPVTTYDGPLQWLVSISTLYIGAAQSLAPLAIGWWFLRRPQDHGQLQLAS